MTCVVARGQSADREVACAVDVDGEGAAGTVDQRRVTVVSAGLPVTVPESVNVVGTSAWTGGTSCGAATGTSCAAADGVGRGFGAGAGAGAGAGTVVGATVDGAVVTWLTGVDTEVSVPEAASTRLVPPGPEAPPAVSAATLTATAATSASAPTALQETPTATQLVGARGDERTLALAGSGGVGSLRSEEVRFGISRAPGSCVVTGVIDAHRRAKGCEPPAGVLLHRSDRAAEGLRHFGFWEVGEEPKHDDLALAS